MRKINGTEKVTMWGVDCAAMRYIPLSPEVVKGFAFVTLFDLLSEKLYTRLDDGLETQLRGRLDDREVDGGE